MLVVIELNDDASSPELVVRRHGDLVGEVAPPHLLGALEQRVHRARDGPRQREPHHVGHELDDEEQSRDDGQSRSAAPARS